MFVRRRLGTLALAVLAALALSPAAADDDPARDAEPNADILSGTVTVAVKDREGLLRDTTYFLGYQFGAIAVLYAMPENVTHWSDEQKEDYSLSVWWDNVRHPSWDTDDYAINYLAHPYWGGTYYVRARERGYSDQGAFWYSVLLSSLYEFGAEALFERPSIQDLVVTPVAGVLVGRYFMHKRDEIRQRSLARGSRSIQDKWLWVLTDPLGALNRGVDRLMRRDVELQIRPVLLRIQANSGRDDPAACCAGEWTIGVTIRGTW